MSQDNLPQFSNEPWTQDQLKMLHEMVRDYDRARWLRGQIKWWVVWVLGLPAVALAVWEPIEKLWKLVRGH